MKINYLILAHNNFAHLSRLISSLDGEGINFFVHFDKKAEHSYGTHKNVTVIENRVDVKWGGFSMVQATIELLKAAYLKPADYYILLSGADYPVKSNKAIKDVLSRGSEFINISKAPLPHKPMSRFEFFYFDMDQKAAKYNNRLKYYAQLALRAFRIKRKIPFDIYVGSQWFALTNACVTHILNTLENDPRYINFFKQSKIPDEAFFQTIIGNSKFAPRVEANLTYADWNSGPSPLNIGKQHLPVFKKNNTDTGEYGSQTIVFARKFDDNSTEIITDIEQQCRQ